MISLQKSIEHLTPHHRNALLWFHEHQGQDVPWPQPMPDGTYLVNKAKGIQKPVGLKYALSVRQSLNGPYADRDPVIHNDGSWTYDYYQEQPDPAKRDSMFTNVALLAFQQDEVPIGVIRQIKTKPNPRYRVMGLALVREWRDGYFRLEGFGPSGTLKNPASEAVTESKFELEQIEFDPENKEDARRWITASIVRRQGQGKFRAAVLEAYGNHCAISTCDLPDALEAAHIFRYLGPETNFVTNGLLLRSDLHTLYDLGLIMIDPISMRVFIAPKLQKSVYADLAGLVVRVPSKIEERPSRSALQKHYTWARSLWK